MLENPMNVYGVEVSIDVLPTACPSCFLSSVYVSAVAPLRINNIRTRMYVAAAVMKKAVKEKR